jgi:hypothetical protein
MPDIAASTSNQRPLTSSRIGAQIVSGPDPGKAHGPDLRFTELMIGRMILMAERWIRSLRRAVIPGFTRSRKA